MISYFLSNGRISQVFLICLAYFLMLAANVSEASKRPVKVGIYDIEPLCETKGTHQGSGLFVEILKYVALKEKWDLRMIGGSLKDGLDRLFLGEIDLLVASDYSKENEQTYNFTRETVISTWGQVYGPKKTSIGSLLDLSGNSVGVVRDDPYNQGLRDMLKRFNIDCKFVEFNHSKEVFHAIEKGWVDTGVVDRLYGMQHQGEYGVVKTPIVLTPVELRFAAPKEKGKDLIEALDYHLKKLKDDPDSIYYRLVNGIFGVSANSRITRWLIWGIGIAFLTAFLAVVISLFLKRQIRAKTAQLTRKNTVLDTEIQKRHEAQEALLQSEGRYRSLVENTLDGYFVFEYPSGEIRFLNGRICELLDYLPDEAYQKSLWDFMAPEDRGALKKSFETRFHGQTIETRFHGQTIERVPYTCTAVRRDGSTFRAETSTSVVKEQGEILIQGTLRDITEQERLKQHLQHAEKMEAVGTLAGGIAHDFNNLLMGIVGNASLLKMDLDVNHPYHERLNHIEEYVQSGSELTRQLLGFARGGKYEVKALGLNAVVEKTSHMFGRTRKEIRIHTAYGTNEGIVRADQGQVEQVLLNMYVNAWHAMPGGGDLYLRTETVTVDDEEMIVDVGTRILERIGYRVLSARSGEEALKIYREKESAIDMVILDMIMPGMGGGKTFEGLKQIDPSVKVILSSGYSINSQASEILNRGCRGFIQKPFSVAELSRKLGEVSGSS